MRERALTLREYMEIQDELNSFIIPDWKVSLNENHFRVAILDEFSELLNSFNWKWWKKGEDNPNMWNVKIEAVDILHFALSIYILRDIHIDPEYMFGRNLSRNYMVRTSGSFDHNVFINKAIKVLKSSAPYEMHELLDTLGMHPEEISAIYVAKAELNYIRQEDGYKDGTYKKVVDGKEDNERLREIVEDFLLDYDMDLTDLREKVREEFFLNADIGL